MSDDPAIKFFSNRSDVSIIRPQGHIESVTTRVSGDFFVQHDQTYGLINNENTDLYIRASMSLSSFNPLFDTVIESYLPGTVGNSWTLSLVSASVNAIDDNSGANGKIIIYYMPNAVDIVDIETFINASGNIQVRTPGSNQALTVTASYSASFPFAGGRVETQRPASTRWTEYYKSSPVIKSSSTEVYESPRFSDSRHRKSYNKTLISTASDSWTQMRIGTSNQAYVGTPFSASRHEVTVLGAYLSGTEAFSSAVPYTSSLYYEKTRTLKKVTWALTASAAMGGWTAARGQLIASSASVTAPHIMTITAPAGSDDGKIVDVKIWVEIMQVSGAGHPPLGQFGIAVRSPNVSWGHAHPIRNYNKDSTLYGPFETPSEFYRDTFLLWEPASLFRGALKTPYSGNANSDFDGLDPAFRNPSWDRDIGIRTVFCDGAGVRNPRDIFQVYKGDFQGVQQSRRAFDAPNLGFFPISVLSTPTASMLGQGYPWFDTLDMSASANNGGTGSPPQGWLNGPGGTNAANEWPTTGSNVGPHFIKPVYPLLDDIYVKKLYQVSEYNAPEENPSVKQYWNDWISFRPGLRGKSMGTSWQLLIAHGTLGGLANIPTYFRQVRIEFTYELTPGTQRPNVIPPRNPRKSGNVVRRSGMNLVSVISGSKDFTLVKSNAIDTAGDYFINGVFVYEGYEVDQDRAVGTTYDLTEFYAGTRALYTASVAVSSNTASYDRALVVDVISPQVFSKGPRTLRDIVAATGEFTTTEERARMSLSGTLDGGNTAS